jgi:hypothetical protein
MSKQQQTQANRASKATWVPRAALPCTSLRGVERSAPGPPKFCYWPARLQRCGQSPGPALFELRAIVQTQIFGHTPLADLGDPLSRIPLVFRIALGGVSAHAPVAWMLWFPMLLIQGQVATQPEAYRLHGYPCFLFISRTKGECSGQTVVFFWCW